MNTHNISAMIDFAYRHSNGDVSIVNQCKAALEELSVLINTAQQSVRSDNILRCQVVGCMHDGVYSLCAEHANLPRH